MLSETAKGCTKMSNNNNQLNIPEAREAMDRFKMQDAQDTAVEFVSKLIDIWDDREFITSMISIAEHDDDKRKIIDFIDAGIDVDVETVSVLALDLADERNARQS